MASLVNMNDELNLTLVDEIELENTIHPAYSSTITEFAAINDVLIFTSSNPVHSVTGYDMESGQQIFFREVHGSGPYELDGIFTITPGNKNIYLLDYGGKLVALDKQGEAVSETLLELTRGQSLIYLGNEKFIATSNSPATDSYLQLIDKTQSSVEDFEMKQQEENILIGTIREAGVLQKYNETLMVSPPFSEGVLYHIQNPKGSPEVTEIDPGLPGFESETLEEPLQAYLSDPDRLQAFITANSTITGLHRIEDQWLMEVFHMHDNYRHELHLLNNEWEIRCCTEIDDHIDLAHKNHIYFYNEEGELDEDFNLSLKKYEVGCE